MFSADYIDICRTAVQKIYPDGSSTVMIADTPCFREPGWELRGNPAVGGGKPTPDSEKRERALRRARARVLDIARSNVDLAYFVTLTLDERKIDRYDINEQMKRMRGWLSNRVQRDGLKYVLVPELHKDGAVHYHGLINDVLPRKDSGTMSFGGGKPFRVKRSEQAKMLEAGARVVYNLPEWDFGFTTAIELYGERSKAINYVCKYIGKGDGKIGGRYYLSGGALLSPEKRFFDADFELYKDDNHVFEIERLGARVVKLEVFGEVAK